MGNLLVLGFARIFTTLSAVAKSSSNTEGSFCDYDNLLYHTEAVSQPIQKIELNTIATTPTRSMIIVTAHQQIVPGNDKQEMPNKIVFYLIKEHGLWFMDDTVSENGSIKNDYLVCMTSYVK